MAWTSSAPVSFGNLAGPPEEDDERGLERVFGVLPMSKNPSADPKHHRAVPSKDLLERGFALHARHLREKTAIGREGVRGSE